MTFVKTLIAVSALTAVGACSINGTKTLIDRTSQVIELTKEGCRFAPTAASIAEILGVPGAPTVNSLSTSICAKIAELPVTESSGPEEVAVEVGGVDVPGTRF